MNFQSSPELHDPAPQEELFNLRLAVAAVLDSWKLALSIAAIAVLIGSYKVWIARPLYEASVLIEVETRSSGFAVGPESVGADAYYWMPQAVSAQMEILRSRRVLGEAAEEMGFVISATPDYAGEIGAAMARHHSGDGLASPPWWLPGSDKYAWGGEAIEVAELALPESGYGTPLVLVAGEDGRYALSHDGGAAIAEGAVGTPLVARFGEAGELRIAVARLEARPGTRFRVTRLRTKDAADELRGGMRVLERGAKGMFAGSGILEITLSAPTAQRAADIANAIAGTFLRQNVERLSQGAERKLEFLNTQLPRLQSEVASTEQALIEQRSRSGGFQLSEGAKSILESLTAVEREISQLELERAELSQTVTAQHPAMATVLRKLDQLRRDRDRINARISSLPDAESRLLQLTRDSKVASELYISLLNKAQELKVAKAGTIGNVHIVDTAVPVNYRVEPKARRIMLSWITLGLVAGIGAVFLRRHLDVKLHWAEDAERRIGIPVYATIPFSDAQAQLETPRTAGGQRRLLAETDPRDAAVESLRSLRASLHFAMMDASRNLVVITGSTPEVGKSFVASNLAKLVADAGKKVLLIDADMRKGRMHRVFGLERSPGLSEAIAGAPLASVIRGAGDGDRLSIITTGALPPNPAELLASDRFMAIVTEACKQYDIVITDTPPILNLADTVVVAKAAGALFVTVRGGVSTVPDVQDCVQRFAKNGIKVDGLIFNGLRPGLGAHVHPQYYHYRYRYGRYRYGNSR